MSVSFSWRQLSRLHTNCYLLKQRVSFSSLLGYKRTEKGSKSLASFSATSRMADNEKASKCEVEISENPYFEKYKVKIQHMQNTNPEEYQDKLAELAERLNPKPPASPPQTEKSQASGAMSGPPKVVPPSEEARSGVGMTRSKGLESVMKLELIQDKTADEITQIWSQYHSGKDCVYAVLKADEYQNLMEKAKECPVFLYPVPRDDGFEFMLSQFDNTAVYFTPLAMFQLVRENAPPCLTLNHYTELLHDKGIVLMAGHYDDKVLKQQLALSLVQQMSIFYGKSSKFYDHVRRFNYQPEQFQYQELIDALKSLPQYDMK